MHKIKVTFWLVYEDHVSEADRQLLDHRVGQTLESGFFNLPDNAVEQEESEYLTDYDWEGINGKASEEGKDAAPQAREEGEAQTESGADEGGGNPPA